PAPRRATGGKARAASEPVANDSMDLTTDSSQGTLDGGAPAKKTDFAKKP
ncbi:MAG: hypothetical protein RLZZ415_112, partial [Pseudomonadota bacterium]